MGGGLPTGGQGSKVYVLCAEPKEHKRFRPGARPGGIGFPAGRIGDRGDREIVYVPNVYVPFPAPKKTQTTREFGLCKGRNRVRLMQGSVTAGSPFSTGDKQNTVPPKTCNTPALLKEDKKLRATFAYSDAPRVTKRHGTVTEKCTKTADHSASPKVSHKRVFILIR